jgi:sugar O-acyltransferase (sialic acid O-acetyltransferase NeuD family)
MTKEVLYIYGAGGFACEVAFLLSKNAHYEIKGFISDHNKPGQMANGLPVVNFDYVQTHAPQCAIVIAVGDPLTRKKLAQKCSALAFKFPQINHHGIELSDFISIGAGSIICAGSLLTTNIDIGEHVHVNLACTVGHDVKIASYTTVSPGVHISGNVHLGENVFVGTGANIIEGTIDSPLTIADGVVIAAGACVLSSLNIKGLYAGVPAKLKKTFD